VLENALVEKEQLCSAVYYNSEDRPKTEISFTLTSVATEKLAQVEARFFEVLRAHMDDKLDMAYMVDCIRRSVRTWKFATERSATSFTQFAITDFLYGKRDGSTLKDVASLREYEHLETWTEAQWRDFIKKWISEAKHVSILGVPSAELSKKLKADEEARVAEQRKRLGEEGLKDLEDKLEKAKAENDKEIPKKLLADFKVPGVDSIHFFDTITARSGSALKAGHPNNRIQKIIDSDHSAQPPFLHFEHISSNFVRISLLIATQSIPIELRPLLSIYLEAFFKLPVNRNGKHVEFEQIVMELERDTVGFSIDCGYSAGNSEEMCISFSVEPDKYETAVKSIQELLSKTVFTQERLAAITTQLLSDVPESKRSGNGMLQSISTMTHYAPGAVNRAGDTLVKALYLKRIKKLLGTDPDAVISQLERIRKSLIAFENFRVLIVGDIEKLPKPVSTWPILTNGLDTSKDLKPIVQRLEVLSEAGKDPGNLTYIVPMATIDSSFALSVAKGPSSYDDPKLPALMVATEYLNSVEGPLWVAVRGTGLAYGANVGSSIPSGWVRFSIYRSPNAYRAFEISKKLVEDFVSGQTPLDDLALEGAISGIVVGFADEQYTMSAAAQLSFVRQVYRQLPEDWNEKMLKMVREVGFEEIKDAMKTFILPLFTPEKANIFVTCATVMEEVNATTRTGYAQADPMQSIKTGFESSGFSPKIKTLADFQDDYGLQADGDEQDDQDENDEDDNEESDADDADEAGTALRGLK
jgi:Zn-dependent M16 (insulinase) family peptidase